MVRNDRRTCVERPLSAGLTSLAGKPVHARARAEKPRAHRKGKRSDVGRTTQVASRSNSEQWPRMPEDIARQQRAFTPDVLDDALASAGASASETSDTRLQIEAALQIARGLPPTDNSDDRSVTSSALAANYSTSLVASSAPVGTPSSSGVMTPTPVVTAADGGVPRGAASYRGLAYDIYFQI